MAGLELKCRSSEARTSRTSGAAESVLRMNDALASTEDVLDVLPDQTVSARAAISSHCDATRNSGELIKSEFGVVHWFEGVVEVFPPDEHTISRING